MKSIQSFLAAVGLLVTVGCGSTTTSSSDSSTTNTTTSSSAQFSFAALISKSLASGAGGGQSGPIVSVSDFNKDGKADFAVLNPGLGSVSVFTSTGSDFNSESTYSTVASPVAINSGDFNGDGYPDLVVVSATSASFLLNDGTGAFPTHVEVALGTANQVVTAADFDGDGHADVAIGDSGTVPLHVIYSDGSALPAQYVTVDYTNTAGAVLNPNSVALGDFDNDGRVDLAFSSSSNGTLALWFNHSTARATLFGTDATVTTGLALPGGTTARGIGCGDFNGDGRLDVACSGVTAASDGFVELFLNTTAGFVASSIKEASPDMQQLSVGDFNLDGFRDIAATSRVGANSTGTSEVDFFLGDGTGGLYAQVSYQVGAGIRIAAIASDDFNADGRPDLVVAAVGGAYVLLNTSSR